MRQRRRRHRGDLVPAQVADQPHGEPRPRRTTGHSPRPGTARTTGRPGTCGGAGRPAGRGRRRPGRAARPRSSSATRSAMMTQVSTTPAATGIYQRRGARSSSRKTSSSGSWVPRWSGWESSRCVALPNWGASMIPAATSQADQPLPPGRAAPGQQAGRQHQQRIGDGARDVDHIGAQPPDQLDERVLRDFGRVVRHVPEGPAVQQPVPVQHVPALQRLVRAVRGSGIGPGHPQVGNEQDDGDHDKPGQPYPPGQAPASEFFLGHLPSGNAGPHILDGTLT